MASRWTNKPTKDKVGAVTIRRFWGYNPFRAPEHLSLLYPSNFVPKNGFPAVKGLRSPTHQKKSAEKSVLPLSSRLTVRFFFFSCTLTSIFQLLDKPWSQLSSLLLPPVLAFNFYRTYRVQQSHCSSIFSPSSVADSRSRAVRKSIG